MTDGTSFKRISVLCPSCKTAHHATEVHFPVENDEGHWVVQCEKCERLFVVPIRNPLESGGAISARIRAREDGAPTDATLACAREMLEHNQDVKRADVTYNYRATPLYKCSACQRGLDELALNFAYTNFAAIRAACFNAQNYLLKGGKNCELAVVSGTFECLCGASYTCAFYTPMNMVSGKGPDDASALLLAGIKEVDLRESIVGIMSKTAFMDTLEKLVVRWRLDMEYVVIASPFVGYKQMDSKRKVRIWSRVLGVLDPNRTAFLTRTSTWSDYRKSLEAEGVPVDLLDRFNLLDPVFNLRSSKQDFHAKFYAGVGRSRCEIFSGSANLVDGPSVENMSFQALSDERFRAKFIEPLRLKNPLPKPVARANCWVHIRTSANGDWVSGPEAGSAILDVVFK